MPTMKRCPWCEGFDLYREYHDREWGVPLRDDQALFGLLLLEGAQAGLSWATILKKRENYRRAFDNFDPVLIAQYDDAKLAALLADPGIVRNRLKVAAAIQNAKAFLALTANGQSFSEFLWRFVAHTPIQNQWAAMAEVPAKTIQSEAMSKALASAGFKFVGSTICYAFMQSCGMVNDHLSTCPRHAEAKAQSELTAYGNPATQQLGKNYLLMDILIIKISGMQDEDCIRTVANVIQDLPHIGHIEISLEKAEAIVEHGRLIEPADILQAIEDAGFPASADF